MAGRGRARFARGGGWLDEDAPAACCKLVTYYNLTSARRKMSAGAGALAELGAAPGHHGQRLRFCHARGGRGGDGNGCQASGAGARETRDWTSQQQQRLRGKASAIPGSRVTPPLGHAAPRCQRMWSE